MNDDDRTLNNTLRMHERDRAAELRAAGWASLCALILTFVAWCCHRAALQDEFFLFGMVLAGGLALLCLFGAFDCLRAAWDAHHAVRALREGGAK